MYIETATNEKGNSVINIMDISLPMATDLISMFGAFQPGGRHHKLARHLKRQLTTQFISKHETPD